ncbi:hypothetical protein C8Q76DRAFT_687957 [Earliella scabrosa]|nr:hypothetical protein C8Q76DRAFT_687957 [Earliella scabrosa]
MSDEPASQPSSNPLSHLKPCPICPHGRVTVPLLCSGKMKPENLGLWYEVCLRNIDTIPDPCRHFQWLADIPRGFRRTVGEYARLAPSSLGPAPAAGSHPIGANSTNPTNVTNPTNPQNPTNAQPGALSSHVPAASIPPPPVTPSRTPGKKFAMSMSPYYAQRRHQDDVQAREMAEQAAAAHAASQEDKKKVLLYWWHTNGEPPTATTVIAPIHPWFHPKDSDHLVARYAADRAFFQYFDWPSYDWVDQGPTSSRLNVSTLSGRTLHFRSDGVTHGPGMPQSARGSKRSEPDGPSSPALSATSSEGRSSWWLSGEEDFAEWLGGDRSRASSEPCATSGPAIELPVGASSSRLPSMLPRSGSTPSLESSSAPPPSSKFPLDLSPAPRGPSPAGWPWLYTCDMAAGFDAMSALMASGVRVEPAFEAAFPGHKYKHSTVGDNFKAYKNALKEPGAVDAAVRHGRTVAGEWSGFRKRWIKGRK